MSLKYYENREQLNIDIEFIYNLRIPYDVRTTLIDELFESWKNNSPDSPWFMKKEIDSADTLINLSQKEFVFENVNNKKRKKPKKKNISNLNTNSLNTHSYYLRKR